MFPKGHEHKFEKNKWEKGQSGNPNGRPKKMVSSVIKKLRDDGFEEVSREQVRSVYMHLLNLTMKDLKNIINSEDQPALLKIVSKAILSKEGFEVIEKILDRAIGKAVQQIEQKVDIISPTVKVEFTEE